MLKDEVTLTPIVQHWELELFQFILIFSHIYCCVTGTRLLNYEFHVSIRLTLIPHNQVSVAQIRD